MINVSGTMKAKTTVTYTNKHLFEYLKLEILIIPSVGKDMEGLGPLYCRRECKMVQSFKKTVR